MPRRSLMLILTLLAAVGSAVIYMAALPALWRMYWPYGLLFSGLGVMQIGTASALLARPTQRRLLLAALPALAVIALWALVRLAGVLSGPDPWVPVNSVIGFTSDICAGLQVFAVAGLAAAATPQPGQRWSFAGRVLKAVLFAATPLVLLSIVVGVIGGSDGLTGAGFPAGTVAPWDLPAGQMRTVEYCRPDGVPLAMDLYMPPATARSVRPAPVAIYVHGGGIIGSRKLRGAGASLANHEGALFPPLQQKLNQHGFVVAAIDFRLPPGTPWPAQLVDTKCAVRFLRAHAADLGIDPARIGLFGSSGGGQLSSLVGLVGSEAGFDRGQYTEQSSAIQAVVDMFGASDFNDFADAAPFARFIVQTWFGSSPAVRRSASPIAYTAPGAPPFLIVQGTADPMVLPRHSAKLAQGLRDAGVSVAEIEVQGAEHSMVTPGQQPSPDEVTARVVDFLTTTLR